MKKLNKLIVAMACASALFVFSGCGKFFEPLPEDFLDRIYSSVEDSTVEEIPEEPTDEVPNEPSEPTEPSEPNEPEQPETPNEPTVPDVSVEPEEPTEPSEPVDPIEPEETVSEPLSFTEGEHTVENLRIEATAENADAVYANGEGTIVTIESGYYDGGDNGSTTAVYARDGAKVVINGGTFKAGEGCAVIYAKNNATVEINGGFYEADGAYNGTYFVLNLSDGTNSTIVVKGGTFVNFNPAENASENPAVNFVADGYEVVSETKENGDIWYTVQIAQAENE